MSKLEGGKVTAVRAIGTTANDVDAYVEVVMQDGKSYAIAFDEHIANEFAFAVLAAGNHLLSKIAARQSSESTLIPGQPVPLSSGAASVAQYGPDKVVLLDLKTEKGFSILFSMSPRSAEVFAKRLMNKKMARNLDSVNKPFQ